MKYFSFVLLFGLVLSSRVLVLLDSLSAQQQYSRVFAALEARGHKLTLKAIDDQSISIIKYQERNFESILFLAQSTKNIAKSVNAATLIEFINLGGNAILTLESGGSDLVRDLSYEFSVDFDDLKTAVVDNFDHVNSDRNLIVVPGLSKSCPKSILGGEYSDAPILFKGVAHRLTGKNPLLIPLLQVNPSTFSFPITDTIHSLNEKSPFLAEDISLVTALQAKNNARVIFAGSTKMFTDELAVRNVQVNGSAVLLKSISGKNLLKTGNSNFVDEITAWAFQEKAVLRAKNHRHHRVGETKQHGIYRIKDEMTYSVDIEELKNGKWVPFQSTDVQFEAVMLDPYLRLTMTATKSGKFSVNFKLPDVYGVFTFKVVYERHGYSWILVKDLVQIRPFRHDDYDRFISSAYPYYFNVGSLVVGFLGVSFVWLFFREEVEKVKTE